MKLVQELHRQAMEAAELADLARLRGDLVEHRAKILEAFNLEKQAAAHVAGSNLEPTRSVLHRSAASLALECRAHREAERLIAVGLGGSPPADVLEELRSLLQDVHFYQHLADDDIKLEQGEFEYQMIGAKVGPGIAPFTDFWRGFDVLDKIVYRTAERQAKKPFRMQGRRSADLQSSVELFVKVPRAASFAIGFRVGRRGLFEEMDPGADVVSEMMECFDHFARNEVESLRARIPDKDYFDNFVGLARKLAPDGKNVGTVGLSGRSGKDRREVLLKPQSGAVFAGEGDDLKTEVERITVVGSLLFANAENTKHGLIEVVPDSGPKKRFKVAPAIMSDVVRPYFEARVEVRGHKKGGHFFLDDIKAAE